MYVYMGMFFNSPQDVPDFGSITMYFVGTKELGYVEEGHKRFRKYAFQSTDLSKLSLITNAIDGSEAFAVDTGITYVLYNGQWSIKSSETTPAKMAEMLGNITQIDYQIVNQLPQTGVKGTIYLIAHETAQGDYYDEYIWTTKLDGSTNESINIYEKIGNTAPIISTMTGATSQLSGTAGLAPAPPQYFQKYFLRGDGTWADTAFGQDLSNLNSIDFNNYENGGISGTLAIAYYWADIDSSKTYLNAPPNISSKSRFSLCVKHYGGQKIQTCIFDNGRIMYQRGRSYQGSNTQWGLWFQIPVNNSTPEPTPYTLAQFTSDGGLTSSPYSLGKSVPADAVFTDTTYNVATQNTNGLMSSTDKTKLDGININNYSMKSDIVVCTENEYNNLISKTAEFYYIIEED